MVGEEARGAPAGARRIAAKKTAPRCLTSVLLGLVTLLDGVGLVRSRGRQVRGVRVELYLTRLGLAEPPADSLVGRGVLLPVGDPVVLGQIANTPCELVHAATGLDIGGGEIPDVVPVLRLLALRRRARRGTLGTLRGAL